MAVDKNGIEQFDDTPVGDLGTQLFWYKWTTFEYALPVTAGAEFGGDTESFEAPETDLDYVRKIGGRRSINDIAYTINYTKVNYQKADEITDATEDNTYMEILKDGSAMIFKGTCAMPSITGGDVRQIGMTIIPSYIKWIPDVSDLSSVVTDSVIDALSETVNIGENDTDKKKEVTRIKIDKTSIPTERQKYFVSKELADAYKPPVES